jgi:hypothetical protein
MAWREARKNRFSTADRGRERREFPFWDGINATDGGVRGFYWREMIAAADDLTDPNPSWQFKKCIYTRPSLS